jgi:hypothetical protein
MEARSVRLEIVPILTQDRSMVCIEHTTGSDLHAMELLGDTGHVESRIGLFGDGVRVGVR